MDCVGLRLSRRRLLKGSAAALATVAAPAIIRAQGSALNVGVLLPRSGFEAAIGQDCQPISPRRSSSHLVCPISTS